MRADTFWYLNNWLVAGLELTFNKNLKELQLTVVSVRYLHSDPNGSKSVLGNVERNVELLNCVTQSFTDTFGNYYIHA